ERELDVAAHSPVPQHQVGLLGAGLGGPQELEFSAAHRWDTDLHPPQADVEQRVENPHLGGGRERDPRGLLPITKCGVFYDDIVTHAVSDLRIRLPNGGWRR